MKWITVLTVLLSLLLAAASAVSVCAIPSKLLPDQLAAEHPEFVDRYGQPLAVSYQGSFNFAHRVSRSRVPVLVRQAIITSEDQRFYEHHGVDWRARANAVYQLFRHRRIVRGARTISEQVVSIIHDRPRTLWARWIEGIEAHQLEERHGKDEILEFYLNQVPFGARRRGIVEAARYYFDRDLSTLNLREQLAIAVMVRSPERLNPRKNLAGVERRIDQLSVRLAANNLITAEEQELIARQPLEIRSAREPIEAGHFVRFLKEQGQFKRASGRVETTLDGTLQQQAQSALRALLRRFTGNQIHHGAVLVVDNNSGEILAWVNDRGFFDKAEESQIDAVLTKRQPGSTLKPFVYAEALERGWTAATIIDDRDLVRPVGLGLHRYRNYSRRYHGKVRLREALGSSLNIPAIQAAEFIGRADLLKTLREFGFDSLRQNADHYGEGLALGNGEVSLKELVHAYTILARGGNSIELRPLSVSPVRRQQQIISAESATIIGDILADPQARILEFGRGGVLQFPTETAVKTGTSTGYRDLWAVGYSARFTVGVWMGNLDRRPTRGVTSSQAPALIMRSIFALLQKRWDGAPLPHRGALYTKTICAETGQAPRADSLQCRQIDEIFSERSPTEIVQAASNQKPQILVPSPGIVVARNPRVPDQFERLRFALNRNEGIRSVRWYVDQQYFGESSWPLKEGYHQVSAEVQLADTTVQLGPVGFTVR